MPVAPEWWDVEVLPSARTELDALREPVRKEALDIIEELQELLPLTEIQAAARGGRTKPD